MLLWLALACAPAWTPGAAGRLDLDPPTDWTVRRNYRFLGTDTVVLTRENASISLQVRPDRGPAMSRPLDLVAAVRALAWGRTMGVENAVLGEHQIVVDGRNAWAITGLRRWRTQQTAYSMVVLRSCTRIAELTLHAPGLDLDRWAADWTWILDSVRLADGRPGEKPLFEDGSWVDAPHCAGAPARKAG